MEVEPHFCEVRGVSGEPASRRNRFAPTYFKFHSKPAFFSAA